MPSSLKASLRQQAHSLGLDAIGFAATALPQQAREGLDAFLQNGHHGQMQWMEEKHDRRSDPLTLWPQARSIITIGHSYAPAFDPLKRLEEKQTGVISSYALNHDYHDVLKKKIKAFAREIVRVHGCEVKVFVDTAPVMEKPLAAQTSLGWQGKHTCLVSREHGSWLFLGEVFTTLAIEPDEPHREHCGNCTRCLDICPTQAFTAPGKLDATRCIAYLTIEHKGAIPHEFRKAIGNRIYGCDDCLAVCPWNRFAQATHEIGYQPRPELLSPTLRDLAQLDDTAFRSLFSASPVKRIGRESFVRNVLIAIGNSGEPSLLDVVEERLGDTSNIVREAAEWAKTELLSLATSDQYTA